MARTKKRSSGTNVAQVALHQVGLSLQDLPEKPKETWSLREAVELLQEPISTALSRGYTYEEIVGILGKHDIRITASSLKRYLAVAKRAKEDATTPKTQRQPRRKAASTPIQTDSAKQAETLSAAETTPTRKRRRSTASISEPKAQTKTAAKAKSTTRTRTASRAAAPRTRKKG